MNTLRYAPIKWASAPLGASYGSNTPEAFLEILNIFEVNHNAYSDEHTPYDYEVERETLKECRAMLLSGEYTDAQHEAYVAYLSEMGVEHDQILKAITQLLSVKTDWIRIAWF